MQIQPISNSSNNNQTFQGKISIENELSYLPSRLVRQAYNNMSEMLKNKEYDLFIRQVYPENKIEMTVQREQDLIKGKKLYSRVYIANNENVKKNLYESVTEYLVNDMDKKLANRPKTFKEKCLNVFDKLSQKFIKIMQDEDEI